MMEVWRPSVTVAAILERDGRFLFVEELQEGKRVLTSRPDTSTRRKPCSPPVRAK